MSKIELSDLVGQGSNVNVKDIKKAEPITAENMEANKAVFNPDANTSKEVSNFLIYYPHFYSLFQFPLVHYKQIR